MISFRVLFPRRLAPPMAFPLHPTTMLELFDADTATLQNMVRSMDAYLGSASAASSFDVDRVRRQRNQLERGHPRAIPTRDAATAGRSAVRRATPKV